MTYEELESRIGKQDKDLWHQHTNGGGWVHGSATVGESAFIGVNAIVWGVVAGDAWVAGDARVAGNARVEGNAWVEGDARIAGDARVEGNARVAGNARIAGNATVEGDAWDKPVLYVLDSRGHGCSNTKHGWLRIGCECHTFDEWVSRFDAIARKHGLSDDEMIEYKSIVELFKKIGK